MIIKEVLTCLLLDHYGMVCQARLMECLSGAISIFMFSVEKIIIYLIQKQKHYYKVILRPLLRFGKAFQTTSMLYSGIYISIFLESAYLLDEIYERIHLNSSPFQKLHHPDL